MKNQFINSFKSSIKIKITGKNIERFIRKIIQLKIEILDIKIKKYNEAIIKIYKKDLDKIEEIKTIYDIEIIETFGFIKIKKIININKYLIISIMIGYILLLILTSTIFKVEIIHDKKEIRTLLKDELEKYGIKEKRFKKSYKEIQKIKKKILNDYKNKIEWIEIEEVGTKYIVRVEERILTKNKKEISTQNIVAKKSAILTKIEAKNGEIVKNINDYVKKGDVVITGDIKLNEETKSITGADGKIYGEVWYKTTIEYPLHYKEVMMKKNKKTVYAIKFLNKDYSIEIHPFKTKKIKEKTLFKNNLLPLRIVKQYQTETKEINEKYTKSQAIKKATEMAKKKIESKLNDNEYIIDYKRLNVDENNSKIVLELFFSVCEDITDTQKIDMEQIEEQKEE